MTTVTPPSNTVQTWGRAGVIIIVIGAIVGAVQLKSTPQAQEVWALPAPAPLSSPIDLPNDPPEILHLAGAAPYPGKSDEDLHRRHLPAKAQPRRVDVRHRPGSGGVVQSRGQTVDLVTHRSARAGKRAEAVNEQVKAAL